MNNKREQFSTTFPPKFISVLRKHALIDERINMSEMIERYQNAYLEKLEREKSKGQLKKQLIEGYQTIANSQKRQSEDEIWDETGNDGLK
jgi:2-keto-3-deoxy-galactonokinase